VLLLASTTIDPVVLAVLPASGALAGVALTTAANWMTERRRWRREREAAAEDRRLEVRQATRLVEQELWEAEQLIAAAAVSGEYGPRLPTTTWNAWREYLARHLGVADWHRVTSAFDAINDLNWSLDSRESESGGVLRVAEDDRLELRWRAVRTAAWILRAEADEAEKLDHWLAEDKAAAAQLFGAPARPKP
jgi:hypothetical protein